MNLDIIYHDPYFVAINKPPGLLVHRSPIARQESRFAIQLLRDQIGQRVYPIHRLDRPTSGVLLFALNPEDSATVQQQFAEAAVEKTYLAICRGYTPDTLYIDHPVKTVVDKFDHHRDNADRKPAQTVLSSLGRCELNIAVGKYPTTRYSLVKLVPRTGRRHQLRAHMKHISHPIIGDAKYGRSEHNRFFQQQFDCQRLLLAAIRLRFFHPIQQQTVTLCASPGEDFCQIAQRLGWQKELVMEISDAT